MRFLRRDTFDQAITDTVVVDYGLPPRFRDGDVVLDLGCHIGAFAIRAANRGARVVGYEASRENYALARMNTAAFPGIEIRWAAVWRSDVDTGELQLTPSPDPVNTGGASVIFSDEASYHEFLGQPPAEPSDGTPPGRPVSHAVPTVSLDEILRELGRVRLLKIDVEGAELPIFLTSRELARIDEIVGEIHEMTPAQRKLVVPGARVGELPDDRENLRNCLAASGFAVGFDSESDIFTARRG